jgi:proline iminopeptidase
MTQLYPPISPYDTGFLSVSDRHRIYFEQSGNPAGKPIVVLHGGPGGGSQPLYRQYFNPTLWRIIQLDQRGCGQSTPHAELHDNTTWDLVRDIELLRQHLGVDLWVVFGGSWGSTLSLAYSETHPDKVLGLILRGIFLLRRKEIQWFYQSGCSAIFPDAWAEYLQPIPIAERQDLLSAYYRRLTSDAPETQLQAARAWSIWEASTSKLIPDSDLIQKLGEPQFAIAFARIECHYFIHGGFFESDNFLIEQVDRIRHIPAVIVQGRYDVVCPMESAWELHQAWPEAELVIVPDAGHSMTEPGIRSALIEASDRFAQG